VRELLKQYKQMKKMFKDLKKIGSMDMDKMKDNAVMQKMMQKMQAKKNEKKVQDPVKRVPSPFKPPRTKKPSPAQIKTFWDIHDGRIERRIPKKKEPDGSI